MTDRPNPIMRCFRHGEFEAVWVGDTARGSCPTCYAEQEQERRQREAQVMASRFSDLMNRSGIPPLFQEATLENFTATTEEQRAALAACREFVDSVQLRQWGAPWLVGTVGVGKTHLACAMASAYMRKFLELDRWASAIYTTPRGITRNLRSTWRKDSNVSEEQVLDLFAGAGLLILDEVGASVGSESETAQISELLDLRYGNQLPVVLVSNLTPKEIRGALGERAYDRLRQGAKVVPMNWPSARRPA